MFKIMETAKAVEVYNQTGNEYYFRRENCRLAFYCDQITFTELGNAMKRGQTCEQVSIYFEQPERDAPKTMLSVFNALRPQNCAELIDLIRNDLPEFDRARSYTVRQLKAFNTFSPFVKIQPIKRPEKWTRAHIYKGLMAGQITAVQKYRYSDDYAFDASVNFFEGRHIDALDLARELVESGSDGYFIHEESHEGGKSVLTLSLWGFDSKRLIFTEKAA